MKHMMSLETKQCYIVILSAYEHIGVVVAKL